MYSRRRLYGLVGFALLLGVCMACPGASDAAQAPVFTRGQKVVAAKEEVPAFVKLEKAQKGGESEIVLRAPDELITRASANVQYEVLAQKGDWLQVRNVDLSADDPERDVWVPAGSMLLLEAFLKDPANRKIVLACPDTMPGRIITDLDEKNKKAVLRLITRPSLDGGDLTMEVWNSAEKSMLWTTADAANLNPGDNDSPTVIFWCHPLTTSWPQAVGDINADGKADILYVSSEMYRERPWSLTLLSWNGKRFVYTLEFTLVAYAANMPKTGPLDAEAPEDDHPSIFVDKILGMTKDGKARAVFRQSGSDDSKPERTGVGTFSLDTKKKTFRFYGWETPLKEE